MLHDIFIAHAGDDKSDFVRRLAEALREANVEVWFDEFSLHPGDSLRKAIDLGLSQSRFGAVVLSPSFFQQNWPQWELNGLVQRHLSGETDVILPIWHGVTHEDVLRYSPPLADIFALKSSDGLNTVVARLLGKIHPRGSTLIHARDYLMNIGHEPPVISDDWWLDVVEHSASNDAEGTFQEAMGWGRWGFPLPPPSEDSDDRGWRLAWTAAQMLWQQEADAKGICQLTRPEIVHDFIQRMPGLVDACHDHMRYVLSYAPQLAIRGFGGPFEDRIEAQYRRDRRKHLLRRTKKDRSGTGLTTNHKPPRCSEELAIRASDLGGYEPVHIAAYYFDGELNGPPVELYDHIDCIAWLLSDESMWLPPKVRRALTVGMADRAVWPWSEDRPGRSGFKGNSDTGQLASELYKHRSASAFGLKKAVRRDLELRLAFSTQLLGLPERAKTVADRFMEFGFIPAFYEAQRRLGR
jgi:hypothetical protein